MAIVIKKNWNISNKRAQLTYLAEKKPPSFDEYKKSELKYNSHIFGNLSDSEWHEKHDSYVDYLNTFNNCCKLGEVVEIINTNRPDVIIFSKEWKGSKTLHSDLELWLWKDYKFPFIKNNFRCEFFSFGQIEVPANDPISRFEGSGKSLVSHSNGIYNVIFDDYNSPNTIKFMKTSGLLGAREAHFKILK